MAVNAPTRIVRDHALAWALLLSLVLHALAALLGNPFQFDETPPPKTLEVALVPPPAPEPPPPAVIEPPPAPPPPKPVKQPPPLVKPEPKIVTPAPSPTPEPPPFEAPPPPPVVSPQPAPPAVMTASPVANTPPSFTAPTPPIEPPRPVGPTPREIDDAKNSYSSLLQGAFAKYRKYPRLAQMRGWQGVARIKLEVSAEGTVISSTVSESSGHDVLDRQALEMVGKATPLPQPPAALRGQPFTIFVPIAFRLE